MARGLEVVRARLPLVADAELGRMIRELVGAFERHAAWRLEGLRRSVIHNDANDFNLLVGGGAELWDRDQHVVGLIDLGDMVESWTVARPRGGDRLRGAGPARPARGCVQRRPRLPRGVPARGG
ncbi:MAG: phosphotransferase [Thermoanaerobaculaceae bacterium]